MLSIQVEPAMDPKPSASEVSFKETRPEQLSAASADLSEEKFVYGRDKLVASINATGEVLQQLRAFNKDQWILRYPEQQDGQEEAKLPLSVLRVDLKLGATQNASTLVNSMEKSSVGRLLDERMSRSDHHLQNLRMRIIDTQSKVLVTGDLNAGKSTFINALMRRELVPTDQQPCTSMFCEIRDANQENDGREEVHVIYDLASYDPKDSSTFTRRDLSDLEGIFVEQEEKQDEMISVLKCFCVDSHTTHESLLHNGAVDIALIDAPGLNQDSVKTTALFAREEEIDVIVFVVSAENHFTLSAREFLQNASNDKAYVFVVVNKYDQIRNKEKCHRRVLEQIRELSPRTFEEADELVHFVDSRTVCDAANTESMNEYVEHFSAMENNLRQFVLRRRAKSKLLPAKTYMERLLSDVLFLVRLNQNAAQDDLVSARRELSKSRPALAACEASALKAQRMVEGEEDRVVSSITQSSEEVLTKALETVGNGESAHSSVKLPAYPGLLNLWQYAQDVREALLSSLHAVVRDCESMARNSTTQAVEKIGHAGEQFLPKDIDVPKRIFMPEAMFSHKHEGTVFAGLGVSLDIVNVRLTDLFDVPHHFSFVMGRFSPKSSPDESNDKALTTPSFTVGLGALSLLGGHALNAKTIAEAFVRFTDILGSRVVRRWAAPVLLLLGAGAVAWIVTDLPNAVPRNVGRNLQRELKGGHGVVQLPGNSPMLLRNSSNLFATMHSMRTMREVRKVLRLASWDIQEKFRVAISQHRANVSKAEAQEKLADKAVEWLSQTAARSAAIQSEVACLL